VKNINDVISEIHKLIEQERNKPDCCDEEGFGDGEDCYIDGRSQGRFEAFQEVLNLLIED